MVQSQGSLDFSGQRHRWSVYQQDIFAAVEHGEGNIAVCARAGAAKTTSLVEAVRRMPRRAKVLVVAFNKEIREELARRLPLGVDVLTTHALGLKALKRNLPSSVARFDRLRDMLKGPEFFPDAKQSPWRHATAKLVERAKATLAKTPGELDACVDAAGLVLEDLVPKERRPRGGLSDAQAQELRARLVDIAGRVLLACAENPGEYDFSDMLWVPVVHGWAAGQWDFVVVDEAQDLSAVQLELIASTLGPEGRLLVVGDPLQAIYKFRGADAQAFDRLVARFKCSVLPLSITYRCPVKVVELARRACPDFEAAEGAADGVVRDVDELPVKELQPGDFVLSRKNAPLIRLAIKALAAGLPAAIAGRDFAKDLGAILRAAVQRAGADRTAVIRWLCETYRERIRGLLARELDPAHLEDELSCMLSLIDARESPTEAAELLDRLCLEKPGNVVLFSSVHRAKGLERQRVYVLTSTFRTPLAGGGQGPGRGDPSEETALWYVAITRAQRELVLVRGEK